MQVCLVHFLEVFLSLSDGKIFMLHVYAATLTFDHVQISILDLRREHIKLLVCFVESF